MGEGRGGVVASIILLVYSREHYLAGFVLLVLYLIVALYLIVLHCAALDSY